MKPDLDYDLSDSEPTEDASQNPPLPTLRHSTAHVLAAALKRLYPGTRLGIGPPVEDGFYYDVKLPSAITPENFPAIEAEMQKIIDENQLFERTTKSIDDAKEFLRDKDEPFKVEIVDQVAGLGEKEVSFYTNGDFTDLCRGPHVRSTKQIKAFKIMTLAGAYWRGDEKNDQLTRVYGTAWHNRKDLKAYLKRLEEAEKRDHRKLGRELDLYSISENVGSGLIFWHPKLGMVRHLIEQYWREEHLKRGYQFVYSPHISSERLFEVSGHLENYGDLMYSAMDIDGQPYRVKPMNCPGHIQIYKTGKHSYRELPLRYAELGTVYRYERSGVLHGMLRVRGFTVDDSHIFCTEDQMTDEVEGILELTDKMMTDFGFRYECVLATRPEDKTLGTDEQWERATSALRDALERRDLSYEIDEGGGTFYAPKIDIRLFDAIGRAWQGPTIQIDLNLPERFNVIYAGSDGRDHRVAMIHRAILGSLERFVGGLIEHYAGEFPLWLAPEQVRILTVAQSAAEYAHKVASRLREAGIRVTVVDGPDKIGAKIRHAEKEKIPWMLIVGDRDESAETVSPRRHGKGAGDALGVEAFVEMALAQIREKR